jgi:hypothetical protein
MQDWHQIWIDLMELLQGCKEDHLIAHSNSTFYSRSFFAAKASHSLSIKKIIIRLCGTKSIMQKRANMYFALLDLWHTYLKMFGQASLVTYKIDIQDSLLTSLYTELF